LAAVYFIGILKIEYNYTQMGNMLNLITKSKIRQRLILLFIYNSDKEYYINEAAKLVKTSAGTAQRELEKLASFGLLKKEKKANLAFFKADIENPLFYDIRNMVDKTIGIEYLLKQALAAKPSIKFAFLFGSYVMGGFNAKSDLDLFIIGDASEKEIYRWLKNVEEKIVKEINYHLSSAAEFKKNLKKSFFHKEIIGHYLLLIGDKNEFRKFIKSTA
jgi:predicted nucleotidyltransferase